MTTFPLTDYRSTTPIVDLLDKAATQPEHPLLIWDEGQWTYAEFAEYSRRCGAYLADHGVRPGQRVAIISRNSAARQAWQFGSWWIGAVEVSVNYDLTGEFLAAVLNDAQPDFMVLDDEFRAAVAEAYPCQRSSVATSKLPHSEVPQDRVAVLDRQARNADPGDLASLIYTSGTTGPSKGVMLPAGYTSGNGYSIRHVLNLTPDDVGYFVLPFFHADFHVVLTAVIQSGSSIAIREKFSASGFWSDAQKFGATWSWVVGFILSAVMARGGEPGDHKLERFLGAPFPDAAYTYFEDTLGITMLSMFGQTEADGPTFDTLDRRKRGGAGWASAGFDVEIHDSHGNQLPPNTDGELVYRPRYPHMMMLGYWNRPEATVAAWRDLWFRSGDRALVDDDGFFHFLGRMADSIRRRGENVSAYELETAIRGQQGVVECAAVGVADEFSGEQEIKLFVVIDESFQFNVDEFAQLCQRTLPRYAIPRYVEVTAAENIVRSAGTGVVQKHRLLTASEESNGMVYTIDL